MNTPNRIKIIVAVSCYIAAVLLYVIITYVQTNQYLIKVVDDKLLIASNMATNTLHNKLSDNMTGENAITENEDFLLAMELKSLASELKVKYIYSLIQRDDTILFVSSSPTVEEVDTKTYVPVFLSQYTEADPAINQAFLTGDVQFSEYQDRWGHFRSVFVPLESAQGKPFVIGVDVDISEVIIASRNSLFWALAIAMVLSLISIPLLFLLINSVKSQAKAELDFLYKDEATGLANKNKLIKDLQIGDKSYLALIEIDNFSALVNALGIAQSDALKIEIAKRLSQMHFKGVKKFNAYAVNSNQFSVCTSDILSQEVLDKAFENLFNYIEKRKYYLAAEEPLSITIRIGAVYANEDALLLSTLALSQAKTENKQLVFYNDAIHLPKVYQTYLSNQNRFFHAFKNGKVRPFYQPIFQVNSKKIVKYEALARVVDDYSNVIMLPDEFMPIAYQSRLCHSVTLHILKSAISDIQYEGYVVCINLSASDIADRKTRTAILEIIKASGLGAQLEFEILENQVIEDYKPVAEFIRHLKLLGSRVGIDDLGKHYSNLDRLLNLPIDYIKIDGSIVSLIEHDQAANDIMQQIVEYAIRKKVEVIAEHCANQAICQKAASMGAHYLQGYYIGRPDLGFIDDTIDLDYQQK